MDKLRPEPPVAASMASATDVRDRMRLCFLVTALAANLDQNIKRG